ncbi:MAG TPA: phage holin family protein [Kofleriaceae bacterium]
MAIEKTVGNVDLLVGIVEDTRELVSANVDLLRGEMSAKISVLGSTLGQLLIGIGVFVVTATLLCLAIAATLIAVGLPMWIALWIVSALAFATGYTFIKKARATSRELLGEAK